jgi:transposase
MFQVFTYLENVAFAKCTVHSVFTVYLAVAKYIKIKRSCFIMIHPKMKYVYVGIDSHKDTHCAVVLNCFFEKLGEISFKNIPSEFEKFFTDVTKLKLKGTSLAFGLEDVSAYGRALTVFLKGKKAVVKHVNASLVASERKSRNILHKTDSEDAQCCSRVLLSRFDTLPNADPDDSYWVLSSIVARRKSIVKMNVALKNHVQTFILSHYPSYSNFFTTISHKSALAFYEKYPSPSALDGVTEKELDDFFKEVTDNRQWKGRANKILEAIKKDGNTKTSHQDIRDIAIKSAIKQITANDKELDSVDAILEKFLDHFDYKLTTMKGIDTVIASYIIAEIGNIERFSTPAKLARYSGVAPVTYASGKTDVQFANQRGNRTLATIFYHLAVLVTMTAGKDDRVINPFFFNYYNKKITEGKTKRQALKCVQRRLVNIIWSMMKNKTAYINPPQKNLTKDEKSKLPCTQEKQNSTSSTANVKK